MAAKTNWQDRPASFDKDWVEYERLAKIINRDPNGAREFTGADSGVVYDVASGGDEALFQKMVTEFKARGFLLDATEMNLLGEEVNKKVILSDIKYAIATLSGREIQVTNSKWEFGVNIPLYIEVTEDIPEGTALTVKVNTDTAIALQDIDSVALTSLDKGFYTLIARTGTPNFFLLAPKGAKLDAIIGAIEGKGGTVAAPQKVTEIVNTINAVATWDADLIAENIVSGKDIFGVIGTFDGKKWASGTFSASYGTKQVRGLSFRPHYVFVTRINTSYPDADFIAMSDVYYSEGYGVGNIYGVQAQGSGSFNEYSYTNWTEICFYADGFQVPLKPNGTNYPYQWIAIE